MTRRSCDWNNAGKSKGKNSKREITRPALITEDILKELGIHVRDRKDRLLLLHILNKTLEDRIGCALYERLDPGQQAHLVHIRQQEELKQWFADNFPDYAEVVDCCIRTLLEELIEDSS